MPSERTWRKDTEEKLGFALTKVYEKANSVVNLVLPCPTGLHKYLMGEEGDSILRIPRTGPS